MLQHTNSQVDMIIDNKINDDYICCTKRISIRFTKEADINYVVCAESDSDNSPFIQQWSEEKHKSALTDESIYHFIIEDIKTKNRVGYAILVDIGNINRCISLQRLVITEKGKGYGGETLGLIKYIVFEKLRAHRLKLIVRDYNERARKLYIYEGFIEEGIMRECIIYKGEYKSSVIMSMLEQEYFKGVK